VAMSITVKIYIFSVVLLPGTSAEYCTGPMDQSCPHGLLLRVGVSHSLGGVLG
jgi:hypothetical protein